MRRTGAGVLGGAILGIALLTGSGMAKAAPEKAGAKPEVRGSAGKTAVSGPLSFTDISGKRYGMTDIAAAKASVFLFVSCQCPISNVYTPRFLALAADYRGQGVAVYAVYSDRQESTGDVARHVKEHALTFPAIKDLNNALADRLGATATPQAIVVDATGSVRYRGRIDDNPVATHVTIHDLNDALDAILAGKPVAHPHTLAIGCAIRRVAQPAVAAHGVPTYAVEVAPILRARCEGCHHPGEVAPFSLQTYTQASAWAADIKRYTQNRQMPPWKPVPGYGDLYEEHTRKLTDAELTTLAKWADAGAPLGDAKKTPAPRQFPMGWELGEPDMILMPEKEYHLAADGDDVYRNFIVKSNFTEDRWVKAVEVHPGNRGIVHHVIAYIDGRPLSDGYASEKLDGQDHDGQPGYTSFGGPGFVPTGLMGGWAPGNAPYALPDGIGTLVPKGARIVIQVHYHKDGKPETDLTRMGIHFCRATVDKELVDRFVFNFGFHIPPGASNYEVKAETTLSEDSHLLSIMPHMHLLGREMKIWATLPDGTEKPLVWIKDWDFNWQLTYPLKEPLALPRGSKIKVLAYYDNSDQNSRNPNRAHLREVGWGEQTTDEMCVGFAALTRDDEHLAVKVVAPVKAADTVRR